MTPAYNTRSGHLCNRSATATFTYREPDESLVAGRFPVLHPVGRWSEHAGPENDGPQKHDWPIKAL